LHPRNLSGLRVFDVFAPGMVSSSGWRSEVDRLVASEREAGGSVFVSSRLLSRKPEPEWDWIEGDDPRVTWLDLHGYFARLDFERPGRPGEEFLLLRPGGELRAAPSGPTQSSRPPSPP
jgi:hypothetical protein